VEIRLTAGVVDEKGENFKNLPERTEVLDSVLSRFPNVEALLHVYLETKRDDAGDWKVPIVPELRPQDVMSWKPPTKFEELWNLSDVVAYSNVSWTPDDPRSEPNHPPDSNQWWFPKDVEYPWSPVTMPHNGWLTIRASSAKRVPYPDIPRGQDGLYNWRLLKSRTNFTWLTFPLGFYIRNATAVPHTTALYTNAASLRDFFKSF